MITIDELKAKLGGMKTAWMTCATHCPVEASESAWPSWSTR